MQSTYNEIQTYSATLGRYVTNDDLLSYFVYIRCEIYLFKRIIVCSDSFFIYAALAWNITFYAITEYKNLPLKQSSLHRSIGPVKSDLYDHREWV